MSDAMVERAAGALHDRAMPIMDGLWPCHQQQCTDSYREDARNALDAAMPLVETAEALDALPIDSRVIDGHGQVWKNLGGIWRGDGTNSGSAFSEHLVMHGRVLRLIWTPEP